MRHKRGVFQMALGLMLLAAAGGLLARNRAEDRRAGEASDRALRAVNQVIASTAVHGKKNGIGEEMPEAEIDGQCYIGRLTIPRLKLELPILSEWSDDRLKLAPCRYSGTAAGEDLVLLAHNYRTHFGPIRRLKPGDLVHFADMNGTVFAYQVTATAVLEPAALEEVTAGIHDLTLVTCTYGGQSRLVVYCDQTAI